MRFESLLDVRQAPDVVVDEPRIQGIDRVLQLPAIAADVFARLVEAFAATEPHCTELGLVDDGDPKFNLGRSKSPLSCFCCEEIMITQRLYSRPLNAIVLCRPVSVTRLCYLVAIGLVRQASLALYSRDCRTPCRTRQRARRALA